jgi:hypothetical protein
MLVLDPEAKSPALISKSLSGDIDVNRRMGADLASPFLPRPARLIKSNRGGDSEGGEVKGNSPAWKSVLSRILDTA